MLTFTILWVSFFVSLVRVHGSPLVLRDVFNPHITSPSSDTVWVVGAKETVTWETSGIPPNLTNPNGRVLLGYMEPGDPSLHLQVDTPLAQGFPITDGQVEITVPNVPPQNNYIIVLMGDSGNASPEFAISDNRPLQSGSSAVTLPTTLNSSPIPITGTTITGGVTTQGTGTTTQGPATSPPVSTPTSPPVSGSSSPSSTSSLAAGSSPTNNLARTLSRADSMRMCAVGVVSLVLLIV